MYSFKKRWFILQLIPFLSTISTLNAQVTIQSCSDDIVSDVLQGADGTAVTYPLPEVTSITGNPILLTQSQPSGSFFPLGDTPIEYTYFDVVSTATCSFVITVREVSPCDSAPCLNGGLCLATTTTDFECACGGCFSGQFCEIATQACATNPCNDGQCVPFANCNRFVCQCPPCSFGQTCEISVDACRNNNCLSSAVCVPADTGCDSYTCQCLGCFTGQFCQIAIPNPCDSFPCLNGGTCSRIENTCSSFQCSCQTGFTGDTCQTVVPVIANPDPCNSLPCLNGVCIPEGSEYVCICLEGYAGINCDTVVATFSDRCSTATCQNGGTCYNSYDSLSGTGVYTPQYCCICAPGFGGRDCADNLNFGGIDQCAQSQGPRCSGAAQCLNKYNGLRGSNGHFCNCPVGLIGPDCSIQYFDPCSINPCANGVCMPFFRYFICQCFAPFVGDSCDTIPDIIPPVIQNCPGDFTSQGTSEISGFAVVTWVEPTATDAVSEVRVTRSREPGALYPFGATVPVLYTFEDESGNVATCSFTVQVQANTAPSVPVCPSVPPVTSFTGNIGNFVSWTIGDCTDAQDGSITPECTPMSGSFFNVGSAPVTCTCTDSGGLSTECNLIATVDEENTAPSVPVCPSVPPVTSFTGNIGNFVSWTIGDCNDAQDGSITPICNSMSGSFFIVGSTTVTCTCTDSGGLFTECDLIATVDEANTAPLMPVCPSVSPVESFSGNIGNFVSWTIEDCTDAQDGSITPVCNPMSGSFFIVGTTTVTCTCTDSGDLSSECTFNAEVVEANTAPSVPVCPSVSPVVSFSGNIGNFVSWTIEDCTDTQDGSITPGCTPMTDSFFNFGSTTVTCTCTDSGGLTSECDFIATVIEANTAPSVPVCPSVSPVVSFSGNIGNFVSWTIEDCTDTQDDSITPECTPMTDSFFNFGSTTVTCTCTDSGGLTSECDFIATVIEANTAPLMPVCPSVSPVVSFSGNIGNFVFWTIEDCNDAQDGSITPVCNPMSGSFFNVGSTTVTCTCTDSSGLTAECDLMATVIDANTPPSMPVCPSVSPVVSFSGNIGNFVSWTIEDCTDAQDGSITPMCNPMSGSFFNVGSTNVTCTCTDSGGLFSECTFNAEVVEGAPPTVVDCPQSPVTQSVPFGNDSATVFWVEPSATSNTGGVVTVSQNRNPGDQFSIGETEVTYTFTDELSQLTEMCTFFVIVQMEDDTTPPVVTCPSDYVGSIDIGLPMMSVVFDGPSATDNSGIVFIQSQSHSPGDTFPVGSTMVMYVFADTSGNTADCQFCVILDRTLMLGSTPSLTILDCPVGDIERTAPPGVTSLQVTWVEPTPTSNSVSDDIVLLSNPPVSGSNFPVPSRTGVLYDFFNIGSSLREQCEFDIVISANIPPSVPDCPLNVPPVTSFTGNIGNFVSWTIGDCNDAQDGSITPVCNPMSGSFFNFGTTTVTCTCTNSGGLSTECEFNAVVDPFVDNTPPSMPVCPNVAPVVSFTGDIGNFISWTIGNCVDTEDGSITPSCSPMSGSFFSVGSTPVVCTCTDSGGFSSNCTFNAICLPANNPPAFVDCSSSIQTVPVSPTQVIFIYDNPTCTDPDGDQVTVSCDPASLTVAPIASQIQCTCIDTSGATDTSCILETNSPPPNPMCPIVQPVTSLSGINGNFLSWDIPACFDSEDGSITPECLPPSGSFFRAGDNSVTCTCTDTGGLSSDCSFIAQVSAGPVMCLNVPGPIEMFVDPGVSGALVTWVEPSCSSPVATLTCSESSPQFILTGTTNAVVCMCSVGADTVQCAFTISVMTTGPVTLQVMNCPSTPIQVTPTSGSNTIPVVWTEPFALTNSGSRANVLSQTHRPGDSFNIPSVTQVTYVFEASDASETCTFEVRVAQPARVTIDSPCPNDFTTFADPGVSSIPISWNPPTAVNENGVAVPVNFQSHFPGAQFSVPSTTTVTYVFSDRDATASCSFRIIASTRIVPPTIINCPNDIQTTAISGTVVGVTWEPITAVTPTGQLGVLTSATHDSGDLFGIGKTPVTIIFADPNAPQSTATCEFQVCVSAPPDPPTLISCPSDISQRANTLTTPIPVFWSPPTAITAAGGFALVTMQTHQSGDSFPIGNTPVSITLTDQAPFGQSVTCTFQVTVLPPLAPPTLINCPADITLTSSSGDGVMVSYQEPTAITQNGQLATLISQSNFPGETFPVGKTTVRYTFADPSQPTSSTTECVFCITIELVLPNPPVITFCPGQITTTSPTGGSVTVSWNTPTALSGGQASRLLSQTHSPGSLFPVGVTAVQYVFSDPNNEDVTSTCDITVEVLGPPTLVFCPDDVTEVSSSGAGVIITWDLPSAVTSQGTLAIIQTQTHFSGSFFSVGITCVEITFVDLASGLTVVCRFKIIVLGPPVVTGCPADQAVTSVQDTVPVTWVPPTATSTLEVPLAATATHTPGSSFQSPSTTMVMYSFTDPDSALTSQCVFTVTVIRPDPPTLVSCPTDIMMSVPSGPNIPVTFSPPTAVSSGQLVPCLSSQQVPPTFPVPSMTTIVYTCTDVQGLSVTCAFDIIITVELSPPTVSGCPGDIILVGPRGATAVPITWIEPTAVTSSGLPAEVSSSFSPGDSFPIPTNAAVTYIFTDPLSGLQDNSCSFFIIIESPPVIEAPTILGCPANVELDADNAETVAVSWAEPSATSNSPGGTVSVTSTHVSGSDFLVPSSEVVVYTFTDPFAASLISECRFTVTVTGEDTVPPTIENCPGNILLTTMVNTPTQSVAWTEPTATDRGQPVTGVSNFSPGEQFPTGTSTGVLYRFTDAAGNQNQCTFTVSITVIDVAPPVVSNCPEVISITAATNDQQEQSLSWTEPTAVDNFGAVTVTQTHMPGDSFAVDTSTLVTYTFTDDAGNMAVCIFAVSVTSAPDDPPNIVFCPPNIMEMAPVGAETLSVLWQEPVAQDDSELPVGVIASHMPGDLFVVDDTTSVIYTFTDNAGQVAVCTFTVTVTAPADVNPPSITGCPMSVSFERVATGSSIAVVEWVEPVATDQESVVTVEQSHTPPLQLPVGASVPVTYTFSDRSGNSARCSFTIFVLPADSTPPVFMNCPNNIRVPARVTDGDLSAVGWLEPVAMDRDSEPVVVNVNFPPGTEFPVGAPVSVVYTATDSAAVPNTAECTFIVEVLPFDNVDPIIINCPPAITESVLPSVNTMQVFWTPPMTVDIATFTSNFQPGDAFAADSTTEVEYTLTDSSGNTATCDFTVTVVRDGDPPALQVTCPRLDIEMSFPVGIQEVAIATLWPTPVAVEQFLEVMTTVSVNPDYPNFANGFLPVDGVQRQVRYSFMDSLGNAMDCVFFVTLNEDTGPAPPPVFTTCPTTVLFTLTAQTGATAARTWLPVQVADPNGGPVTLTSTPANIDSFPVGSTSVIITATNEEGTSSVCTFFVLVTADDIPPEANCPTSVMEVLPMAVDTVVVTWNVEFTDNSGTVTVMQEGPRSGASFGEGTSTVMYTATDEAGNVVTCSFNIIVTVDMVRPTPSDCPTPFTAYTNDPSPQMVVLPQTEAVDANGITLIGVQTDPAVNLFTPNNPPQPQTVTFTFTDGAGRTAECMIELNFILDQTNPTFVNCPSGTVSATLSPGMSTVAVPAVQMISALDDSNIDPTVTTNPADITMFPFGMTPVTFTATDMAGNTAQCNFIVDVNAMPCNPNPCPSPLTEVCTPVLPTNTFTCAADADLPIVFGCPSPMMPVRADPIPGDSTVVISNLPVVTATDNLDEDLDVVSTVPDGNIFPAGTTTVTITFTDDAGNVATCMYDVIVADDVPPVIEGCPPPPDRAIQVTLSVGQDTITVPELTVTDNLDANPTVIRVPDSNVFSAGITPVSVTATDLSGNVDVCAYNVIVSSPCDNVMCTPPSRCVNGPTGATCSVPCEFAVCDIPTFFCLEIQGIGTCSGMGNFPDECLANCPVPTAEVSCQAGHCINSAVARTDCPQGCLVGQTCVNSDCVADSDPPTITCPTTDVTQSVLSNQEVATIMVLDMITVNDNLDPNPVVLTSPFGNQFSAGATLVTATAVDDAGNVNMCTFNVVVTVSNPCAPNPCANGGTCTPNGATFLCLCEVGFSGDTCEVLSDTVPPVIVGCPSAPLTGSLSAGQLMTAITIPTITATDNVDPNPQVQQTPEGNMFPAGTTTVTVTATDAAGNNATPCTFNVVVSPPDTIPPVIVGCPSTPLTGSVNTGQMMTTITLPAITATDNVDTNPQLQQIPQGNMFPAGTTTVTVTATDAAGNSATPCTFNVEVSSPCDVVTCNTAGSSCVNAIFGTVCAVTCGNDNCGIGLTCMEPSIPGIGVCVNANGVTVAACSATCGSGESCQAGICVEDAVIDPCNSNPCPATQVCSVIMGSAMCTDPCTNPNTCQITEVCSVVMGAVACMADTVPPVIVGCPTNAVTGSLNAGQSMTTITLPTTATDNVDPNPQLQQTPQGNMFQAGITQVTVTAMDAAGNSAPPCTIIVAVSSPCDNVMCTPPSRCVNSQTGATCGVSCEFAACDTPTFFCLEIQPDIGTCTGDSPECLANCPVNTPAVSCQAGHCVNSPVARTDCPQGCLVGQTCVNGNCVADLDPPTITCPTTDVTQSVSSNQEVATIMVLDMITVNDDLDPNPVVLTSPFTNQFPVGTTEVTATAIDDAGLMGMCMFNVEVTSIVSGRKKRGATDLDDDDDGPLIFEGMNISEVEKLIEEDVQNQEQPIVIKEENISVGCGYYLPTLVVVILLVISFALTCRRSSRNKLGNGEV